MKLQQLLDGLPGYELKGSPDTWITGISANSKRINPGNLFIVKKGQIHDGSRYIQEAIQAGAVAIATPRFDPHLNQTIQLIHPDMASVESALAATYYGNPSHELFMVGITGTNGKTTTTFLIKQLLDRLYGLCGLIGTIEYIVGPHRYPPTHTTPDIVTNQHMLRDMVTHRCRAAVMEVTSHALDQGRVDRLEFDVAIFSNLTLDHLDYHGSMDHYAAAKKKLFDKIGRRDSKKQEAKWALINRDSPWASYMAEGCSGQQLSFGVEIGADLVASNIMLTQRGTHARVSYQGKSVDCFWPFPGRFNIYNCLAAIATCLTRNIPLDLIAEHMPSLLPVPGRLQPVENTLGLKIFVDFAHTDDALLNALTTLREVQENQGRLIVVFGCGGDRDPSKRPKMAQACEKSADFCIVTSDNPRSEDPAAICEAIVAGFTKRDCYQVEVDRRKAIQMAITLASPDDLILIAGRGHESHQILAQRSVEFHDVKVAADLCRLTSNP